MSTWVDVPYVPGYRFKSTPHGALPPVGRPRYAIPYFLGPHLDWWYDANYHAARPRDVA